MPDGRRQEPVLRFAGATMAFRLEDFLGETPPGRAEDLVGRFVELNGDLGTLRGTVRTVEPYVCPTLGPGHWVTLGRKGLDD